jgi:hypothetical protein
MKTKPTNIVRVENINDAEIEANDRKLHRSKWEYISRHDQIRALSPQPGMTYFIYHGIDQAEIDLKFPPQAAAPEDDA